MVITSRENKNPWIHTDMNEWMNKKENLFWSRAQQIQIEEIMEFEYHHVTSTIVISILSKNYWRMPELSGWKFDEEHAVFISQSVSLQNFINLKEANSVFIMEKSGRYHHDQVMEVTTTSCGPHWHLTPPDMMHWERRNIAFMVFLSACITLI